VLIGEKKCVFKSQVKVAVLTEGHKADSVLNVINYQLLALQNVVSSEHRINVNTGNDDLV